MRKPIDNTSELLSSLSTNLDAEELLFAGLQGLIAAEISMRRQDMGLSQQQLADRMGVSQGLISKWEAGETNFTLQTLVRIAAQLDISMQSPYVSKVETPSTNATPNIIPISSAKGWKSAKSPSSPYDTVTTEELKEM